MSDNRLTISAFETLLRRKEASLEAELAAVRADLAEVERARGGSPAVDRASAGLDISKLPLTEAVYQYLKTEKRPKKAKQIWEALAAAGREVEADNPVRSVQWALKKLVAQNDDVFSPGWGKWHLKSKYTKAQLTKLIAKSAGRGGRSASEHVARTKAGLEKAKASGKKLGATPRVDDAMKRRIQEMAALKGDRKMTLGEIAAANEIALSTIFYIFPGGRKAILAWKPADSTSAEGEMSQEDSVAGPLFDTAKTSHVRLVK